MKELANGEGRQGPSGVFRDPRSAKPDAPEPSAPACRERGRTGRHAKHSRHPDRRHLQPHFRDGSRDAAAEVIRVNKQRRIRDIAGWGDGGRLAAFTRRWLTDQIPNKAGSGSRSRTALPSPSCLRGEGAQPVSSRQRCTRWGLPWAVETLVGQITTTKGSGVAGLIPMELVRDVTEIAIRASWARPVEGVGLQPTCRSS